MKQATANKMGAVANLQTTLDSEGNFVAQIDPTKAETQLMRITEGAIAGAAVAIPPSALSIPVSIMVGEGVSLATSSFSQTLGITDNKINVGGPSVSFTASQDVVAANPMTLSIPFGSLSLSLNDADSDNIVVMYRWTIIENGETKFEAGILPGENVTRAKNKVSFQTTKFGTFQVGVAEKKITTAVVARTEEPPALKSCERYAAEMFPSCTTHGQVGCMTTDAFRAVDMAFLKAEFILSTASIPNLQGNVLLPLASQVRDGTSYGASGNQFTGTFSLNSENPALKACERFTAAVYQPCTKDAQVGCVTTDDFKAADMTLIRPEIILAGRMIAGVAGTVILPSRDKVVASTTYGPATASVTGTSFAAIPTLSYSGATGTTIKLDQTFSVSPTSLVINGSNIIACGTKVRTPSLPAGLEVNQSTCAITGAPTALLNPTIFKIVATNAVGPSSEADLTLAVLETVATPTFSVAAGSYGPAQSVTLSTATAGATIYYTTDGTTPTTASTQYSAAIIVSSSMTIKAFATKSAFSDSAIASATYTINGAVATPTFSVAAGSYGPAQSVTLSTATAGATIYYTTDGTTPTTASTQYSAAIIVSSSMTIKAFATKSAFSDSAIASATYTIHGAAATPTFSVAAGSYGPAQTVALASATTGATIYYTTNGIDPTTSSSVYSTALTVSSTTTIKAMAVMTGFSNSTIASSTYTINGAVTTPTFSVAAGSYNSTQSVTISTATGSASMYYTTNGTTPTTASTLYTAPVSVSSSLTLRAFAVRTGFSDSSVASASYVIDTTPPSITLASVTTTSPGTTLTPSVAFTSNETGTYQLFSAAGCSTGPISSSASLLASSHTATTNSLTANSTTSLYIKAKDALGNSSCTLIGSYTHDNTAPLPPVIADVTRSFNAAFSTSIQQGVPSDANFKEFRYTTNGTDPTCSTGTVSSTQPTSVSIAAATTTLKAISCDKAGNISPVATAVYTYDVTPPNAPTVNGTTPTANTMPTWNWTSSGGGGTGTYRYKLNNADLTTGASQTTNTSFTQTTTLPTGSHTLYVQERDETGNWSDSGSFVIQLVTIPAAPTLAAPTRYNSSLGLSWASVTDATAYNLYWSNNPGVTTASTKILNVSSVFTHTSLTGGTTYYYRLAAVKASIEGPLSNEVSAATYSYPAPTVTGISPSSGSTSGGTTVTVTGNGFVSGTTVSIGGTFLTIVTFSAPNSLTAITPAGSLGTQIVVVTNPDGQVGTLASGYSYINTATVACMDDCYREGSSPNFAQVLAIGTERQGPSNTTLTLQYASGSSGFKIWKDKNSDRILNASGLVSNGWQQQLIPEGTAFNANNFTNGANIAGRVCPQNVFLSHSEMTATNRCLYYDAGNASQTLNAASGNEASDWLQQWDQSTTGRGPSSSYYEGNIKTCADKGMRLPTMFETKMNKPASNLPVGDAGVNLTGVDSTNGVPSLSGYSWTASANTSGNNFYWTWSSPNNVGGTTAYTSSASVRCVLPNNISQTWSDVPPLW